MPVLIGNFFIKTLINSPFHPLLGKSFAVITVTGCKTGKPISTPINTVCIDGILTVISMCNQTWWRNLRKGRPAQLSRAGKRYKVRGEIVETLDQVISGLENISFNILDMRNILRSVLARTENPTPGS